tara:strand:- start:43 stop:249 length:207 start_codon:yes stop_codon:yes gene_type:complete
VALEDDTSFLKQMKFDFFNLNEDDGLMSIEDLKDLRIRKQKIESEKKARKYILEINQRFRKMRVNKYY